MRDVVALARELGPAFLVRAVRLDGVGTAMGVSDDAPSLDMAYKLVSYAGRGRIKLSPGKALLPGRKQVFRREQDGRATADVIAAEDESHAGRPLLSCVMRAGSRISPPPGLDKIRAVAREERSRLPERMVALEPSDPSYPVEVSPKLAAWRDTIAAGHLRRG